MPYEAADKRANHRCISSILEALQQRGLLSAAQCDHVSELCGKTGAALDEVLSKLGFVAEETLADFYSEYFEIPRYRGKPSPNKELLAQFNVHFLERRRILPLQHADGAVSSIIVDPLNHEGVKGLAFSLEAPITPLIATASEFDRLAADCLQSARPQSDSSDEMAFDSDSVKLKDLASAEPTVRLVNRLIVEASRQRASDIHIEPKERGVEIRFRIDGVLHTQESLTNAQGLSVVSRLKILAGLDIAERRRPQDGRFSFAVAGRSIDLRLSTTPTIFGESLVVRLLEKASVALDLPALGFSDEAATALRRLIVQPNGIVLVTGPTGSGKTTTLYALLEMLARNERKILTIEDPVEYQIDGVSQTQVNPAIGLDFANAMRSFLRHDPDVIMVGEMRDLETVRTAVQASLTGHLVLSTLHTNDAPSAITRLLDMGVEDYLVASTLHGVVAQRLVRRLCPTCHGDVAAKATCEACHQTGYLGRGAVSEILLVDDPLKAAVRKGVTSSTLKKIAAEQGFQSMSADAAVKIECGVTDKTETERTLGLSA